MSIQILIFKLKTNPIQISFKKKRHSLSMLSSVSNSNGRIPIVKYANLKQRGTLRGEEAAATMTRNSCWHKTWLSCFLKNLKRGLLEGMLGGTNPSQLLIASLLPSLSPLSLGCLSAFAPESHAKLNVEGWLESWLGLAGLTGFEAQGFIVSKMVQEGVTGH